MKLTRAVGGGLAGGLLAIAMIRGAGWLAGSSADLCALLGAVLTDGPGRGPWIIGCVAQLAETVLVAILFAGIFEWGTRRAGAVIGLLLAVPLVVVAGLSVGLLPGARLVAAGIAPPGAFMAHRGAEVIVGFVLAHLAFGVVVGVSYGRPRHAARPAQIPASRL
jgi:hypothetical protein